MGKTVIRVIGGIAIAAIAAVAGFSIAYPKAARAVWCNLTVGSVPLDETAAWDGGASYTGVAYASDSPSQYLDLYVPESEGGSKPHLFVIIHG
ncbi:MAG: hypothetical protein Q4D39_04510, partial [Coriobacteriaceae bacterium]|nr:hypothetical protein [Coriobacteriaceae bacterium]